MEREGVAAGRACIAGRLPVNAAAAWQDLERLASGEHDLLRDRQRADRTRRPGPLGAGDDLSEHRTGYLRDALWHARMEAGRILAGHPASRVPAAVGEPLLAACSDIALAWGAAALLRDADFRAVADLRTTAWAAAAFGLRAAPAGFDGATLADALRCYELGVESAWGPTSARSWCSRAQAAPCLTRGHVLLASALVRSLAADLVRERAAMARRARAEEAPREPAGLRAVRGSACLGESAADWLAANADALSRLVDIDPTSGQAEARDEPPPAPAPRAARPSPAARAMRPAPVPTRAAAPAPIPASTPVPPPVLAPVAVHWIEIQLIGEDDAPIPFEPYQLVLPDGREVEGRLDGAGLARHDGMSAAGTCRVRFPRLDRDAWRDAAARPG